MTDDSLGSCAYFMVTRAWNEKEEKEAEMKLEWLKLNGYDEVDILLFYLHSTPIHLSRMTPLVICLSLNIMTLRITSSATTTPT